MRTNIANQKSRKEKVPRLDSKVEKSENTTHDNKNLKETDQKNIKESDTVSSNKGGNSDTKMNINKNGATKIGKLEKGVVRPKKSSKKGEAQKQNLTLKADAIAQMLEDDDDEYR